MVDILQQSVLWWTYYNTLCYGGHSTTVCYGGHTTTVCVMVDILQQSVLWWTVVQSVLWWTYYNSLCYDGHSTTLCVMVDIVQQSVLWWTVVQSVLWWTYYNSLCYGGHSTTTCVMVDILQQSVLWWTVVQSVLWWTYYNILCYGGHTTTVCVMVDILQQSVLWWTYYNSLCYDGYTTTVCVMVDILQQSVLWWTRYNSPCYGGHSVTVCCGEHCGTLSQPSDLSGSGALHWKACIMWNILHRNCGGLEAKGGPGAGIMEADDHQVTTVFTVQRSFHNRNSTNRVSWNVTIVRERAVTPHLVVHRWWWRFMILGLSSADCGMTVGLWKLSSLDSRRPPWYQPLVYVWAVGGDGVGGGDVFVVGWMLHVPAMYKCIWGTDLLSWLCVLPHWGSCCLLVA